MNEKHDKEKKGVDNDAYDGKKESDVEKGNEKDEKWKNNYVPFDESKEKENEWILRKMWNNQNCVNDDAIIKVHRVNVNRFCYCRILGS